MYSGTSYLQSAFNQIKPITINPVQSQGDICTKVVNAILAQTQAEADKHIKRLTNTILKEKLTKLNEEYFYSKCKHQQYIDRQKKYNTSLDFLLQIFNKMSSNELISPRILDKEVIIKDINLVTVSKVIQMTNQTKIYTNIVMQKELNWNKVNELISKDSYALMDTFRKRFAAIKNKQLTPQSTQQKEGLMQQIKKLKHQNQILKKGNDKFIEDIKKTQNLNQNMGRNIKGDKIQQIHLKQSQRKKGLQTTIDLKQGITKGKGQQKNNSQQRFKYLEELKSSQQIEIVNLKEEKNQANNYIKQIRTHISTLNKDIKQKQTRISELQNMINLPLKINGIPQHQIQFSQSSLQFQKMTISKQKEIYQRDKQIIELKKILRDVQQNTKLLQKQLEKDTNDISALKKELTSQEKHIEKCTLQKQQLQNELEKKQKQIDSLLNESQQKEKIVINNLMTVIEYLKNKQSFSSKKDIESLRKKNAQIQQREISHKKQFQSILKIQQQKKKNAQAALAQQQLKLYNLEAKYKNKQYEFNKGYNQLQKSNDSLIKTNESLNKTNDSLSTQKHNNSLAMEELKLVISRQQIQISNLTKYVSELINTAQHLQGMNQQLRQLYQLKNSQQTQLLVKIDEYKGFNERLNIQIKNIQNLHKLKQQTIKTYQKEQKVFQYKIQQCVNLQKEMHIIIKKQKEKSNNLQKQLQQNRELMQQKQSDYRQQIEKINQQANVIMRSYERILLEMLEKSKNMVPSLNSL